VAHGADSGRSKFFRTRGPVRGGHESISPKHVSGNFRLADNPTEHTSKATRYGSASRLHIANIETLDESVLYLEDVDHHSVGQEIALWVTHHLMNFDNDFPLAIGRDLDGLDMRIEDRPLTFPVAAHSVASADVATFHSICPNDVRMHGGQDVVDVAAIKEVIHSF
jgi:hypothetical protein